MTGRRFGVYYVNPMDISYKQPLKDSRIKRIEGTLENFNPSHEIVLYDEKFGFNIIHYKTIVVMEEIK